MPAKIGETDININPNPVQVQLTIQTDETIIGYKIIDLHGRIYLEGNNLTNTIEVTKLPIGVYFISMQTQSQTITKSFIKN